MSTLARLGVAVFFAASTSGGLANDRPDQTGTDRAEWRGAELDIIASLRLSRLPPAPTDPSNAVEGSPAAVELGKRLFNDARFSQNQAVSCATCHDPAKQFQDGLPVGRGVGPGSRRAMPVVGSGYSPWLFWDGRKDSLWSQALGPLEDGAEHGGNRARYAHLIQDHYRGDYEAIFQALPDLGSVPRDASPTGTVAEVSAWNAMDVKAHDDVSRLFANIGKAIAAYEKTLVHGGSRFDSYAEAILRQDPGADRLLTPGEVNGLRTFIGKGQCVTCHNGPLFTDQQFHNTGVPPRDSSRVDHGRATAIVRALADEFNSLGRFSDAKPAQCEELRFIVAGDPALEGAFKTPSLRDVALRPPYMHAGQFASIEEVIAHYVKAPAAVLGHTELSHGGAARSGREPIRLSGQEITDLAAFLATLSGPITEVPGR
ncbi:MAG: cytochrome c peroxidase [Betaproteobacteria bacterium]